MADLREPDEDDRLYIGKVRLAHASEPPQAGVKDNRDIEIGLQNLRLNGREWEHFIIRFEQHQRFGVVMQLSSDGCMPDCFSRWPNSAWKDEGSAKYGTLRQQILIPLNGHADLNHFGGLASEDKKLVSALWSAFPQLMEKAGLGRRGRERASRVKGWQEWGAQLAKRHAASRYVKMGFLDPVFEGLQSTDGMMMMAGGADTDLQPAGRPALAGWDMFQLPAELDTLPLYSWLLASAPVKADATTDDIAKLLDDPVFQLK